ncbi:MAG: Asp-tRNA(Asn)/Glu-tRNA(Gln) amidotransferase GatCAB subunit B, partial [Bdellovibrionaceae bacterium]|nr:Asp-tRNA(Asn)/Glu-tRNA(Gln) amidotransferase GatCAB subunit B [Bdellovibrio sp.]
QTSINDCPVRAQHLAELIKLIDQGTISGKIAKTVFIEMWNTRQEAKTIIEAKGLVQVSDFGALEKIIDEIIQANPSQVAEFRGGKVKLVGFFVGAVMKASKGQANPDMVNDILKKKLETP